MSDQGLPRLSNASAPKLELEAAHNSDGVNHGLGDFQARTDGVEEALYRCSVLGGGRLAAAVHARALSHYAGRVWHQSHHLCLLVRGVLGMALLTSISFPL